ncbi:chloroplast processing peptidase-like [Lotus japonicus]|uniref:signal peptidase I n=1 Tax=Lotus japonicus TaxID=34305 RepID=I3T671_LOTJA|nr:chloroplast processing peptidase-like [Lotus japonicus]AFK48013.1 unknown [Lotus japonicus]
MSFLRPSALYHFLITYSSLRWMPCQSSGFLRWPGLDGFLRLLVVGLLWSTFSELRSIPSSSMFPTLRVADRIIVEKASYYFRSPAIHEIVTFRDPTQLSGDNPDVVFIKRVVAKEGDTVEVHHGRLYINGVAQEEDFIAEQPAYTVKSTYVPKGHVYVLGDNRNNSYDSHVWGPLPVKNIIGRYVMCFHRPTN